MQFTRHLIRYCCARRGVHDSLSMTHVAPRYFSPRYRGSRRQSTMRARSVQSHSKPPGPTNPPSAAYEPRRLMLCVGPAGHMRTRLSQEMALLLQGFGSRQVTLYSTHDLAGDPAHKAAIVYPAMCNDLETEHFMLIDQGAVSLSTLEDGRAWIERFFVNAVVVLHGLIDRVLKHAAFIKDADCSISSAFTKRAAAAVVDAVVDVMKKTKLRVSQLIPM